MRGAERVAAAVLVVTAGLFVAWCAAVFLFGVVSALRAGLG